MRGEIFIQLATSIRGLRLKPATVMNGLLRTLCWGPVVLFVIVSLFLLGPAGLWDGLTEGSLWWCAFLVATFVLHEALHAVGFLAAGARPRSISFKIEKANLIFECGCSDPISLNGVRFAALLPFMVLTPVLFGTALTTEDFGAWAVLTIAVSACAYDLTIVMGMLSAPGDARVIPELRTSNDGIVFIRLADA